VKVSSVHRSWDIRREQELNSPLRFVPFEWLLEFLLLCANSILFSKVAEFQVEILSLSSHISKMILILHSLLLEIRGLNFDELGSLNTYLTWRLQHELVLSLLLNRDLLHSRRFYLAYPVEMLPRPLLKGWIVRALDWSAWFLSYLNLLFFWEQRNRNDHVLSLGFLLRLMFLRPWLTIFLGAKWLLDLDFR
jgi:hypothetical protein